MCLPVKGCLRNREGNRGRRLLNPHIPDRASDTFLQRSLQADNRLRSAPAPNTRHVCAARSAIQRYARCRPTVWATRCGSKTASTACLAGTRSTTKPNARNKIPKGDTTKTQRISSAVCRVWPAQVKPELTCALCCTLLLGQHAASEDQLDPRPSTARDYKEGQSLFSDFPAGEGLGCRRASDGENRHSGSAAPPCSPRQSAIRGSGRFLRS